MARCRTYRGYTVVSDRGRRSHVVGALARVANAPPSVFRVRRWKVMYHDARVLESIFAEGGAALATFFEAFQDDAVPADLRTNLEYHASAMREDWFNAIPAVMAYEDIRSKGCDLDAVVQRLLEMGVIDCLTWRIMLSVRLKDRRGFVEALDLAFSLSPFYNEDVKAKVFNSHRQLVFQKFGELTFLSNNRHRKPTWPQRKTEASNSKNDAPNKTLRSQL